MISDETLRTLITAVSSLSCTAITVWFAIRSLERRDRIKTLENELRSAFEEFIYLYEAEKEYLSRLTQATGQSSHTIKVTVRKTAVGASGGAITLTPAAIAKRRKELQV